MRHLYSASLSALALSCLSLTAAAPISAADAQTEFRDTDGPVINSMVIRSTTLNMDAGERAIEVEYDIADAGVGLGVLSFYMKPVNDRAFGPTLHGPVIRFAGEADARGVAVIEAPDYTQDEVFELYVSLGDVNGNFLYSNAIAPATPSSRVQIRNANADRQAPVAHRVTMSTDTLDMTETNQLRFTYDVSDRGSAGLDYFNVRLEPVDAPTRPSIQNKGSALNGVQTARGELVVEIPDYTPSGEYDALVFLNDQASNNGHLYDRNVITPTRVSITNANGDTTAPRINRMSFDVEQVDITNGDATVQVDYDVFDAGGSGLDSLEVRLRPADPASNSVITAQPAGSISSLDAASGSITLTIPQTTPSGAYHVEVSLSDRAGNVTASTLSNPNILQVNEGATRQFGPFDWVGDASSQERGIFRLTGVPGGPPSAIRVAVDNAGVEGFTGAFTDCSLTIRPERHNEWEYLITAADLGDCGGFERADLHFEITPQEADLTRTQTLRRFVLSSTGLLTDMSADLSALANRVTDTPVQFGPFEWVEANHPNRRHYFRLSGLDGTLPSAINIAVGNASEPGYQDVFTQCALTVRPEALNNSEYLLDSSDLLADCGDFGRADLRFEVEGVTASRAAPLTLRRLVKTAQGAITDFAFDFADPAPYPATSLGNGSSEVVLGPFEWTGGATAPTRNLFRIAGINGGLPEQIDVAIDNAITPGFSGAFTDCSLTIRAARGGEGDYMIDQADLADCGAFGRADLRFRVQALDAQLEDGLTMRRFALGAAGDITDFGFDHDPLPVTELQVSGTRARVQFGPFEWSGDQDAGTQNVFRITGLTGVPLRIDVALANASVDGFDGNILDCSLVLRPERSLENEYLIRNTDLGDCEPFTRADVTFRITALRDQFDDSVQMRRFAVTRAGGLTDFGSDKRQSNPFAQ